MSKFSQNHERDIVLRVIAAQDAQIRAMRNEPHPEKMCVAYGCTAPQLEVQHLPPGMRCVCQERIWACMLCWAGRVVKNAGRCLFCKMAVFG